jgi:hypothetical protein
VAPPASARTADSIVAMSPVPPPAAATFTTQAGELTAPDEATRLSGPPAATGVRTHATSPLTSEVPEPGARVNLVGSGSVNATATPATGVLPSLTTTVRVSVPAPTWSAAVLPSFHVMPSNVGPPPPGASGAMTSSHWASTSKVPVATRAIVADPLPAPFVVTLATLTVPMLGAVEASEITLPTIAAPLASRSWICSTALAPTAIVAELGTQARVATPTVIVTSCVTPSHVARNEAAPTASGETAPVFGSIVARSGVSAVQVMTRPGSGLLSASSAIATSDWT